jgi:hypothetical protein
MAPITTAVESTPIPKAVKEDAVVDVLDVLRVHLGLREPVRSDRISVGRVDGVDGVPIRHCERDADDGAGDQDDRSTDDGDRDCSFWHEEDEAADCEQDDPSDEDPRVGSALVSSPDRGPRVNDASDRDNGAEHEPHNLPGLCGPHPDGQTSDDGRCRLYVVPVMPALSYDTEEFGGSEHDQSEGCHLLDLDQFPRIGGKDIENYQPGDALDDDLCETTASRYPGCRVTVDQVGWFLIRHRLKFPGDVRFGLFWRAVVGHGASIRDEACVGLGPPGESGLVDFRCRQHVVPLVSVR